ncbi:MAG: ketoacyl-ACP synthase III [Deltaproteobacteria bacterium]|nr:ketoacyl-ACP synthase III [Deltaproteobacteria bacterium]
MPRSVVLGTGHYVPEKVVTNDDLAKLFSTSDEWIVQRTGIHTRHYVDWDKEAMGSSELATRAARLALADAQVAKEDIDFIIYATLSPDHIIPGDGVLVQTKLGIPAGVPALDIRNQCSGFIYGLSVADAYIRTGNYKRILLIGSEVHSSGLDFSDDSRDVTVIFGDGAGAVIIGAVEDGERGILSVHLHADGAYADELCIATPSSAQMPRTNIKQLQTTRDHLPKMNGRNVFKHASLRMPEVVFEALKQNNLTTEQINLFIPHQANLRISEMVQKKLSLRDDQVFNNIQQLGNTTAASLPIAIDQARKLGRIKTGELLCIAAFGSGFTWGSALIRM